MPHLAPSHNLISANAADAPPGAAGSNTGITPLVDEAGGIAKTLTGLYYLLGTNVPYNQSVVVTPLSEAVGADGQVYADVPAGFLTATTWAVVGRWLSGSGFYILSVGPTVATLAYVDSAGGIHTIYSVAIARNTAHHYQLQLLIQGTNLTAALLEWDSSNNLIATIPLSGTDSNVTTAGQWGVTENKSQVVLSRIQTWYEVAITVSVTGVPGPPEIESGASGHIVTGSPSTTVLQIVGINTKFDGTSVPTLAGDAGATITGYTVVDATHINFAISAGNLDVTPLTVSENTSGESATVVERYPYLILSLAYLRPLTAAQLIGVIGKFNRSWLSFTPTPTASGVSGCSVDGGSLVVLTANTATVRISTDGANGILTLTMADGVKSPTGTTNVQQRIDPDDPNWQAALPPDCQMETTSEPKPAVRMPNSDKYFHLRVQGTGALALEVDNRAMGGAAGMHVQYSVNYQGVVDVSLGAGITLIVMLAGGTVGTYDLRVWLQSQTLLVDMWTPAYATENNGLVPPMSLRIMDLQVDPGATLVPVSAPDLYPRTMLCLGASVLRGYNCDDSGNAQGRYSFIHHLRHVMQTEVDIYGISSQGMLFCSAGTATPLHTPGAPSTWTWPYVWKGLARNLNHYWAILLHTGDGDRLQDPALVQAAFIDCLHQMRLAGFTGWIFFVTPAGQYLGGDTYWLSLLAAYRAAYPSDNMVQMLTAGAIMAEGLNGTTGSGYLSRDSLHPNTAGQGRYGTLLGQDYMRKVGGSSGNSNSGVTAVL